MKKRKREVDHSIMLSRLRSLFCTSEARLHTCEARDADDDGKQVFVRTPEVFTGTRFESLPNELVFEVFDYLSITDIYYAFYNLNQYFNQILSVTTKHVNYDLKDRNIDAEQLRFMLDEVLPFSTNLQVKSIDLFFGVADHFCHVSIWHRFSQSVHTIKLQYLSFGSSARLFEVMKDFPRLKQFSLSICTASHTDWLDGEKWDFLVENSCPDLLVLSVSIRDIQHPALPSQLEDKVFSSFKSPLWTTKNWNVQVSVLRRSHERIHRVTLKIIS